MLVEDELPDKEMMENVSCVLIAGSSSSAYDNFKWLK